MTPSSMDSLRLAIPRETYSNKYLYFMLSVIGKAFRQGIFEDVKGGFIPENYVGDGFYHFKSVYKPKDEEEFSRVVGELRALFEEELGKI